LIQAIIPVGFMPAIADDGRTIVICSGVTGEQFSIQINDGSADKHNTQAESKCAYSIINTYNNESTHHLINLDISYILADVKITDIFFAQAIISFNYTRGPPHIFLT
jgi:hypothetical protein